MYCKASVVGVRVVDKAGSYLWIRSGGEGFSIDRVVMGEVRRSVGDVRRYSR